MCEEYIETISKIWPEWISNEDRIVMQFLADICKSMNNAGYLTIDDLYNLSEKEVIDKIKTCEDKYLSESFKKFQSADCAYVSNSPIPDKYSTNVRGKIRYINPLVKVENGAKRIYDISRKSRKDIDDFLNKKHDEYIYFDFDFKPYEKEKCKVLKRN